MKEITAKLENVRRKRLSGTSGRIERLGEDNRFYDDAIISAKFRIVEGPMTFVDRQVWCDIDVSKFVDLLTPEVAKVLRDELDRRLSVCENV